MNLTGKYGIDSWLFLPKDSRLEISERNSRNCAFGLYCLFVFGVSFSIYNFLKGPPYRISHIVYYASYIVISTLFIGIVHSGRKKQNFYLNQGIVILICTLIFGLLFYLISERVTAAHIVNFYFAVFIIMIGFELTPFFYLIIMIIFVSEVIYFDLLSEKPELILHVDNVIFCIVLGLFSFYKRYMVSVRYGYKRTIEEMNVKLTAQNIELAEQKQSLLVSKEHLETEVHNQSQELQLQRERVIQIQNNTIVSLSNLVENRDEDTGDHVLRTRDYVQLISVKAYKTGKYPDLNEQILSLFYRAAPMHDIGKIVVPDSVLKKQGELTDEEYEIIKTHTIKGSKIIDEVLGAGEDKEYVKIAKEIASYHHERYDGSGYPKGLKGADIPLSARIMAIADVFDALVSPRCYKEPMTPEEAFRIIEESAGTHFDPELARIFLDSKDAVLAIMNKYQ